MLPQKPNKPVNNKPIKKLTVYCPKCIKEITKESEVVKFSSRFKKDKCSACGSRLKLDDRPWFDVKKELIEKKKAFWARFGMMQSCRTCGGPLDNKNNELQIVYYCSGLCRKARHNRQRLQHAS